MPVFAVDILHGGAQGFGYLMSATGVGALAGAVFWRRDGIMGWENSLFAGILYGIGLSALSLSHYLILSLFIAVVVGFCLMLQMASCNTILQTIVDDKKRGRVISLFVMARRGVESFGSLVAGAFAHSFGTPDTLMIGGIVCLLASVAFATKLSLLKATSISFYKDVQDVKLAPQSVG